MVKIAPSILAADFSCLKDEIIKFNKLKAKFCKYYELKGDNDEI